MTNEPAITKISCSIFTSGLTEFVNQIPGTKKLTYLQENLGALQVELSVGDLSLIEKIIEQHPIQGERLV
jgi:hypothetical protein